MNKIKIGLDLDSVLSDLLPYWLSFYNKDYSDNLKTTDIIAWETNLFVKPECGNKIFEYILNPSFFRNVPVMPNAQNVVGWLSTFDNIELYIVTAYHPVACKDKADWLAEHFPCINQKNIVFCNDKSMVNVDYLLDDSPYNHIGFKGQYILFDTPYNQCLNDRFPRVKSWLEVRDYFKERININA